MDSKKVLAIETSCDDTSIWIVSIADWNVFVDDLISYTQIKDHQKFWWVVPELASRLHQEKIISLLKHFDIDYIKSLDWIAVTTSPGLPWSLLVWKTTANFLWTFLWLSVYDVNHINWHIASIFLDRNINDISFPAVFLTASWWHNDIYVLNRKQNDFFLEHIWTTLDDAAWECFDKVSRMLWWPYPWWPWISDNAKKWKYNELVSISSTYLKKDEFNFSFSWTKSQVYYLIKKLEDNNIELTDELKYDICFAFQESVVSVLANKLIKASIKYDANSICIVWWVSANDRLFEYVENFINNKDLEKKVFRPLKKIYSTDNSAMIWAAHLLNLK